MERDHGLNSTWSTVAGRSRPRFGGYSGRKSSSYVKPKPPSKRQRVSTDSTGSVGAAASKPPLLSLEQFKSLDVNDKLDRIFGCLHDIVTTNERLLKAEQIVYETQNTAKVNKRRIDLLAYKSIDIEARQRRNNLLFYGIEKRLNEDTCAVLSNFLTDKLSLDAEAIFVQRAHRIGRLVQQRPLRPGQRSKVRPIIAAFRDYPDVELILSNVNRLQGTKFGVNRDYPHEIVEARKPLFAEKKRLKSLQPLANISIQYPAKLVMNGHVVQDELPNWFTVIKGDRLNKDGYVRLSNHRDTVFDTSDLSSGDSDIENENGGALAPRSPQQPTPMATSPSAQPGAGQNISDTSHEVHAPPNDPTEEGDSSATNGRPPDGSDA